MVIFLGSESPPNNYSNEPATAGDQIVAPGEASAEPGDLARKSIEPAKLATEFNFTDEPHRSQFDAREATP